MSTASGPALSDLIFSDQNLQAHHLEVLLFSHSSGVPSVWLPWQALTASQWFLVLGYGLKSPVAHSPYRASRPDDGADLAGLPRAGGQKLMFPLLKGTFSYPCAKIVLTSAV
jgi:hypothetical protein